VVVILAGTDFVCVSVHNGDGRLVLDKEEGVEDIGVIKEVRHLAVVVVVVRISNLLDNFLFPVDQLQWLVIDTSNY
jgi:hypothetical protein